MAEGLELKDKSRLRYPINGAWGFPIPSLSLSYTGWGWVPSLAGGALMTRSPVESHAATLFQGTSACSVCCLWKYAATLFLCVRACGLWKDATPGFTLCCGSCGRMQSQDLLCCGSGFQALVLTAMLVGLGVSVGLPLEALPGMLLPLAFATTLTSFIFSLLLYAKALTAPVSALAPGGNSGERGSGEVGVRQMGL